MQRVAGRPGELIERLLDIVDWREPQLRAVATTVLIKALEVPDEELAWMEAMVAQIGRWADRAVDDADNRRRAERFLAWAERAGQLEAAQRRGLFIGMDTDEFRRMADDRARLPVTPETALGVWVQVEHWLARARERLGDDVLASWETAAGQP